MIGSLLLIVGGFVLLLHAVNTCIWVVINQNKAIFNPMKFRFCILLAMITGMFCARAQNFTTEVIDVAKGLPQSYISGIAQDPQGFLWFATRDGLTRYDGVKFKVFRNIGNERVMLPSNIISMIHMDSSGMMWIKYDQGAIDVLDTFTGKFTNIIKKDENNITTNKIKNSSPIARDANGDFWLLDNNNNGAYIVDKHKRIRYIHRSKLLPGIRDNHIMGIGKSEGKIVMVTDKALIYLTLQGKPDKVVPFTFDNPSLFKTKRPWKDNSPLIRKNGEVIICDESRIIIYSPKNDGFKVIALPHQKMYVAPARFLDENDTMYLAYDGNVYILDKKNDFRDAGIYKSHEKGFQIISMHQDNSGVFWLGSNGYGVVKADIRLRRMPGLAFSSSFHDEVLKRLGVSEELRTKGLFKDLKTSMFRWIKNDDATIWMTSARAAPGTKPNLYRYKNGKLVQPNWKYLHNIDDSGISAMAYDKEGKLWGIDQMLRPVLFDVQESTVNVLPAVRDIKTFRRILEINKLFIDDEHNFLIITNLGLLKYNSRSRQYSVSLPDKHLLNATRVGNTLWIASYSDGIIEYHIKTGKIKYHTTDSGLPNNTIYGIIPDASGLLWCSSNKGIFSYDARNGKVKSYTVKDGLPADEFNRFAFFEFPDGMMAFGATKGYTLFAPSLLKEDTFRPKTAITGFKVNNIPADYHDDVPMVKQLVNSLNLLQLDYKQNFLAFEFASLQYNIPDKIRYRYKMAGLDKGWVMPENDNSATYTTIPPGEYTFMVNATNTSGVWSPFIKKLPIIIITPPFWETWWFLTLCLVISGFLIFLLISLRIKSIRSRDRREIAFERETMELEARALRSQMNPHFIFNCLNSIKALIHRDKKQEAIMYLATFSKLTRNQLNNNLKEISLDEELDTCRLYLELESLRFGDKLKYYFEIDRDIDIKSVRIPPLLIQPFIENAIIHGILPKEDGGIITISVVQKDDAVHCSVDDTGIGRIASKQHKQDSGHVSRGLGLAQDRLAMHSKLTMTDTEIIITDKFDEHNVSLGTLITLIFRTND